MSDYGRINGPDLDRYITGNYGDDQIDPEWEAFINSDDYHEAVMQMGTGEQAIQDAFDSWKRARRDAVAEARDMHREARDEMES